SRRVDVSCHLAIEPRARRIEIPIPEAPFTLVDHCQGLGLVSLDRRDSLLEHDFCLGRRSKFGLLGIGGGYTKTDHHTHPDREPKTASSASFGGRALMSA